MRLTLVIPSLGRGGAERTASALASGWASQGNQVTLITLTNDDVPNYPLHADIALCQLKIISGRARNLAHGLIRQLRYVRVLRRAICRSRPDLIVSFMDIPNVLTLVAARSLNVPVVVTEHVHPAYHRIGTVWEILRLLVYGRAGALVCVSEPIKEWFQGKIGVHARVIPNPLDLPQTNAGSNRHFQPAGSKHIVAMGRLVEQKGFDLLIEAFSRVASRHSDWILKIIGEGVLEESLQKQAERLGIRSRVAFVGALADPFPILSTADLFVFSSRFEGFGNALCEAMACGLPVISFDCPSGPSEIIRQDVDGILVPAEDVNALAEAMDRLMSNSQERERLATRAREVLDRFGIQRVMKLWDQLFADIVVSLPGQYKK